MGPAVFAAVAGTAAPLAAARPALLAGWRRVALRGTPYPTLLRDAAGVVDGVLVTLPPSLLPRLHAYEGALYRFLPVRVASGTRLNAARAWIARPDRADPATAWRPGPD
jgi:hypothetical protein